MPLIRLVYFSRSRIEGDTSVMRRGLANILAKANQRNSESGITGALVFHGGYFAQMLEGHRRFVSETFRRICSDDRHDAVEILEVAPVSERLFPQWSMALGKEVPPEHIIRYGDTANFEPANMTAEAMVGLLTAVIREEAPKRVYASA